MCVKCSAQSLAHINCLIASDDDDDGRDDYLCGSCSGVIFVWQEVIYIR